MNRFMVWATHGCWFLTEDKEESGGEVGGASPGSSVLTTHLNSSMEVTSVCT